MNVGALSFHGECHAENTSYVLFRTIIIIYIVSNILNVRGGCRKVEKIGVFGNHTQAADYVDAADIRSLS